MSKTKQMYEDEDDSWEVRAFEEDTSGNVMGCTWPPRSYTCTFCRREFRSAQALGGHMNVHRRDRARLHEIPKIPPDRAPPSTLLIPTQNFIANGLCLFYSFPNPNPNPNPNCVLNPNPINTSMDSCSSSLLLSAPNKTIDLPVAIVQSLHSSSIGHSSNTEPSSNCDNVEELDLELRLGRRRWPTET